MLTSQPLLCLQCGAENFSSARICASCSSSLASARAATHLDSAESDITQAQYDHARLNLAKADTEMLALSSDERKRHLLTALAFWLQSLIYYYKGQISETRTELLLALSSLEGQSGGEQLLVNILNNLGNVEFYHNHATAAAEYYQRSSDIAIQIGAHAVAARALGNLGIISANEGNMDKALVCYHSALELAEQSGEPLREADAYRLLASLYASEGPYPLALKYTRRALALREQIADQAAVCRITSEAADVYLRYRDFERAEGYALEADELTRRTDYKLMQVTNLLLLAELMRQRDEHDSWFNYASHAFNHISIAASQRSEATLQLLLYYISEQDWAHAHKFHQILEESCDATASSRDHFNLVRGKALLHAATQEWDESERGFANAIELMGRMNSRYEQALIEEEYADMLRRRAEVLGDANARAKARNILVAVAHRFVAMKLPHRVKLVRTKLKEIASQ